MFVDIDKDNIIIKPKEFNPYFVNYMRQSMPMREWDKENKRFLLPLDITLYNQLKAGLKEYEPTFSKDFKLYKYSIEKTKEKLRELSEFQKHLLNLKFSKEKIIIPDYKPKVKSMRHQKIMMLLFRKLKQCFFYADMGTGKTKASIDCFDYLFKREKARRCLVLCKMTAINDVWEEQINEFSDYKFFDLREAILTKNFRGYLKKHFLVVNYDIIAKNEAFFEDLDFDMIIADEVHRIGNIDSKRTNSLINITQDKNIKFRIGLSGTPVPNRYKQIFSQFLWCDNGEIFGKHIDIFVNKYFEKVGNVFRQWDVLKDGSEKKIASKMSYRSITYKSEECLDLPPKVVIRQDVLFTKQQKAVLTKLINYYRENEDMSNRKVMKKFDMRARQICSGFLYYSENLSEIIKFERKETLEIKTEKLDKLKDFLEDVVIEQGKKVIIWINFVYEVTIIERLLKDMKIIYAKCTGDIKSSQEIKTELRAMRNGVTCKVLLASIPKAGESLNLPYIQYAYYYSNTYDWGMKEQSMKRTRRKGCEKFDKMFYYENIIKDSPEEDVYDNLQKKYKSHNYLMNYAKKKWLVNMNK